MRWLDDERRILGFDNHGAEVIKGSARLPRSRRPLAREARLAWELIREDPLPRSSEDWLAALEHLNLL